MYKKAVHWSQSFFANTPSSRSGRYSPPLGVICHCAGFQFSFLLPPSGRVPGGGISIPIALHCVTSHLPCANQAQYCKTNGFERSLRSGRLGYRESHRGDGFERRLLADSFVSIVHHCFKRCNTTVRSLEAHSAHEKKEVPLLQRQAIAESRLPRELCLEVSDLRGKIPRLRFELCSLLFQRELRTTVARQSRRFAAEESDLRATLVILAPSL
jgi:hypothetical protein